MSNEPLRALRARPSRAASLESPDPDSDLAALVGAAGTGDGRAWTELARRFDGTLRAIADPIGSTRPMSTT